MSVDADVLDSGAGPGRGWLVGGVLVLAVGLGGQFVDGSSPLSATPGESPAATPAGRAAAGNPSATATPHWRGRILLTGQARRQVLHQPIRAQGAGPRTADAAMRWVDPTYRWSQTAHSLVPVRIRD